MVSATPLPTSRLIVEAEEQVETAQPTITTPSEAQKEWDAVSRGLRVLSQRVLAAMGHWLSFFIVLVAAALWWRVMENPNTYQLVGLAGFAIFGLLIVIAKGRS